LKILPQAITAANIPNSVHFHRTTYSIQNFQAGILSLFDAARHTSTMAPEGDASRTRPEKRQNLGLPAVASNRFCFL
jgi:hypothetical protein